MIINNILIIFKLYIYSVYLCPMLLIKVLIRLYNKNVIILSITPFIMLNGATHIIVKESLLPTKGLMLFPAASIPSKGVPKAFT